MTPAVFNKYRSYDLEIWVSSKAFNRKQATFSEKNVEYLGVRYDTDSRMLGFKRNNTKSGVSQEFQIDSKLIINVECI